MFVRLPGQKVEFPTIEQAQAFADAMEGEVLYYFDDLSDSAKENARQWWRKGDLDYEWWDGVYEIARTAGKCLGIDVDKIVFSGFWSQGDGACFGGSYAYRKGWRAALESEFDVTSESGKALLDIGLDLQAAQRPAFYKIAAAVRAHGQYNRTEVNVHDEDLPENAAYDEKEIADTIRDFAHWIYQSLEREYEYRTSDEVIDESLMANDYTFDEEGNHAD